MSKIPVLLLALIVLLAINGTWRDNVLEQTTVTAVSDSGLVENSWIEKTARPQGGMVDGVATVNGKIYAFGRYEYASTAYDTTDEYNPTTDSWTTKTPMPTARVFYATAVFENKIYIIGGADPNGSQSLSTAVYDPATDLWTSAASIPVPVISVQANVVNDKIYVIGGTTMSESMYDYRQMRNITQVFDPRSDTWSTAADIPKAIYAYASAVLDDKIYVLGGIEAFVTPNSMSGGAKIEKVAVNKTQIYDPATNKWILGAPLLEATTRAFAGATTGLYAPKAIYVFDGYHGITGSSFRLTQVYNPSTDSWVSGAQSNYTRCASAATVCKDIIYVIGGEYKVPTGSGSVDKTVYPDFITNNYQFVPFGYGTFNPLPTPISYVQPSVSLQGLTTSLLIASAAVVAACALIVGLVIKHKIKITLFYNG